MREYLKKAGIRACVYFTIAMLFWCVAGLMFAGPVEGVVITLSLLLAMGLLTLLQTLWFTPLVARRMHYPVRIAGFCLTGLPALALCAAVGSWFPLDNAGAWASFVVIYLVATALLTIGYALYYRRSVGSLDAALARYRESRKG